MSARKPARKRATRAKRARFDVLGARLLRDDKNACLKLARRVLRAFNGGALDVGLTFVHDLEMQALNRAWRHKDEPTDVLSFPLDEDGIWGDLVISVDTARRQARRVGHALDVEIAVLVAHGLAHLAGLDHERGDSDDRVQRAVEHTLLAHANVDVAAGLVARARDE